MKLILSLYKHDSIVIPIDDENKKACLKHFRKNMNNVGLPEDKIDEHIQYVFDSETSRNLARLYWNTLLNLCSNSSTSIRN